MFDVAFSEMLIVAVVALLVIGPKRLPQVARVAGRWVSKLRGMAASAKAEIERELELEELRNTMKDFPSSRVEDYDALPNLLDPDRPKISKALSGRRRAVRDEANSTKPDRGDGTAPADSSTNE